MIIIGDNIRHLREQLNLRQDELGEKVGVGGATISSWEKGRTEPNMGYVQKLADFFNVTTDYLIFGNTPSNIIPLEKAKKVPILGTICAGNGVWCEESFSDYIVLDKYIKADFALIIKGDSMINANIHNGDIAFFYKTNIADSGQIVAVLLKEDNEAVLKKIFYQKDYAILQACNDNYQPIITSDFLVLGILKGIYKEIKQ